MKLATIITMNAMTAYGCPCNDGKSGQDYANLAQKFGYKTRASWNNRSADQMNEGTGLRRPAGAKPGETSHVLQWNAATGEWSHQSPSQDEARGIGYISLEQHLQRVYGS